MWLVHERPFSASRRKPNLGLETTCVVSRLKNEVRTSVLALTRGELNIISVFNLFYKLFEAIKMPSSQLDTPQKNKIRSAAEFYEKQGIKFTKTSLTTTFKTTRD